MNPQSKPKLIVIAIVIGVVAVGILYWHFYARTNGAKPAPAARTSAPAAGGLGSEVYEKSANPVSGKIPQTAAPVPNPIENAYKNPFQ